MFCTYKLPIFFQLRMELLYKDIYALILPYAHPYDYKNLKQVCKLFYRLTRNLRDEGMQLALTSKQKEIIQDIILNPRSALVQAPLSFGKTVTALALSMRFLRCVIAVPLVLLEQWVEEARKTYGEKIFDPKSLESPLYVCHRKISPLHQKFIEKPFRRGKYRPRILLIPTNIRHYKINPLISSYDPDLFIMDECQKGDYFEDLLYFRRKERAKIIGLTADVKYSIPERYKRNVDIISCPYEEVANYVPEYIIEYTPVEEIPSFSFLRETIDGLNLQGHSVIFYTSRYFGSLTCEDIRWCFQVPVFFHQDIDAYKKFSSCSSQENPILVYSYERGCEGLNLNIVQNMVLLFPNRVNAQKVNQAIGRALRVTNPNTCIRVEAIIPDEKVEMVRAFISIISPEVTAPFLKYIGMKGPGFRFSLKRWHLISSYELNELEYYILFHTNTKYAIVENWCQEQDLFTHIPSREFQEALRDKEM